MSRSIKHTRISAYCSTKHGQKVFRSKENRASRRLSKITLKTEQFENILDKMPARQAYGNEWDSPRDGKHWLSDWALENCPKIMRK